MTDFYNVEQAVLKRGFSERYIRERLNDGSLKGIKPGANGLFSMLIY
jgi:hypothetical protein